MAETIVVRWSGPSDAASGSTYRIERTLDWSTWSELAAAQAATAPYASPTAVLSGNLAYGATSIVLVSGTPISSTGYGWIDEALVEWTGKSTNTLTGVTWHSGYGTYASGSTLSEAHESYTDTGVTPTYSGVVYRITHIDASSREAPPAYCWYWYPPIPASSKHCVLIVALGYDVGVGVQSGVSVSCQLAADDQFAQIGGTHLDQNRSTDNTQVTNALGLAFFQCWRSSARAAKGNGAPTAYTLVLSTTTGPLTVSVPTVPDRNWLVVGVDVGE